MEKNSSAFAAWVRKNPVTAFFAGAFLFTWGIYLIFVLAGFPLSHDYGRVLLIAGFGPSLAAMAVSAVCNPVREGSASRGRIQLFAAAALFCIVVFVLDSRLWGYKLAGLELLLDGVLVLIAAYIISGRLSALKGVRDLLTPLSRWRVGLHWYLLAAGLWPCIVIAGNFISSAAGMGVPANPDYPDHPLFFFFPASFLWYFLFAGALNEEAGWRGFAQERLQARHSPLAAGAIVGAFWGLWHLPLHFMGAYPYGALGSVIRIQDIASGVIFAWLYNASGGSLLPVMLLHGIRNNISLFMGRSFAMSFILWIVFAAFVAVVFKMWRPRRKE